MQIHGLNKTTLLDYPGHLAATLFIGGCNMRCPFCHNASLVTGVASQPTLPVEDVLSYLAKRKNLLEGVCITGGEPTLYHDLPDLISSIKDLGLKVKLDTNGTSPSMIKFLTQRHLIDYVAMDIKNSLEKYSFTTGVSNCNLQSVKESVSYLLTNPLNYEFRTTIIKEHHTAQDITSMGQWLSGAQAYYLQSYKDSDDILTPGLSAHTKETLQYFATLLAPYVVKVSLRGVD